MIVTCERCATQFQLDDSRVPARGVRVRCSRCKNAFRVVPPAQRTAEEIAELARRAREDSSEETTQDLAEDSRSRSGSRRGEASAARSGDSSRGSTGSGLETEESDWKFNEDVSAEAEPPVASAREERKPEPPPVRRGAEADDWFRGGGDAPLELDDRPWNASAEPAAAQAADVEQTAAPDPDPEPTAEADSPAADEGPSLDRFVDPEPGFEPAPGATAEDDFDALASLSGAESAQETQAPGSTDELSSESWDEMFGDESLADAREEPAAPAAPRAASRRLGLPSLGGVGAHVARWLGRGAEAFGWLTTLSLFAGGLYLGLAPPTPAPAAAGVERVGALELAALEGRVVENAVGGRLYVVSGRLRNPGSTPEMVQGIEVELLDAAGQPLGDGRAALHPRFAKQMLRESPVSDLVGPPPAFALGPGEERAVEGVFAGLPQGAAAFRVVPHVAR